MIGAAQGHDDPAASTRQVNDSRQNSLPTLEEAPVTAPPDPAACCTTALLQAPAISGHGYDHWFAT